MLRFFSSLIPRTVLPLTLVLAVGLGTAQSASAQTFEVENGASLVLDNGGVWDLEGTTMDFGPSGETARLDERSGARVTGGELTAVRSLSSPSGADPAGLGLELSASVDLGDVTVTRGHTVQTGNGNSSIARYYDVNPAQNNSGLSAELTFSYNDGELNGIAESELVFFKSDDGGSSWSKEGVDSRDASNNAATLGGISSFSRWTLGSESNPLPVEMAGFEARAHSESVRLTWQTAAETNNAGFEVQRRMSDTETWEKIAFVESKAGNGTTSDPQSYQFADSDLPYSADTLEYRLRQADLDGTATVTDPVTVARPTTTLELKPPAPSPARTQTRVQFAVPDRQDVALRLYDTLGRQVRTLVEGAMEGREDVQIDLSGLPSGRYFLHFQAGSETRTEELTVVR